MAAILASGPDVSRTGGVGGGCEGPREASLAVVGALAGRLIWTKDGCSDEDSSGAVRDGCSDEESSGAGEVVATAPLPSATKLSPETPSCVGTLGAAACCADDCGATGEPNSRAELLPASKEGGALRLHGTSEEEEEEASSSLSVGTVAYPTMMSAGGGGLEGGGCADDARADDVLGVCLQIFPSGAAIIWSSPFIAFCFLDAENSGGGDNDGGGGDNAGEEGGDITLSSSGFSSSFSSFVSDIIIFWGML
mmetsp:Transcript_17755/g.24775  ORF Transcript_17755/g.24775 Transcript_17755/m.24775 type:complete len:251 (-) Transcript_17755:166-918(-)